MAIDTPAKIAVLGAGPIGLEAALYARYLGYEVVLIDRVGPAANVLAWGHVRMFSPFGMNCSPLGLAAIETQDAAYRAPAEDALLTGREWTEQYLLPLSQTDLLDGCLRMGETIVAIGKEEVFKGDIPGDEERGDWPFRILLRSATGEERLEEADAVIDATGTFGNPNWLGHGGIPALGETLLRRQGQIESSLPDILGRDRDRYVGKRTLLVGGGYSAATSAVALGELIKQEPGTSVLWITRKPSVQGVGPMNRISADRLPAREQLAIAANELAGGDQPQFEHRAPLTVASLHPGANGRVQVNFLDGEGRPAGGEEFDNIIASVGYRPDSSLYQELQVHQCYASEGPMKLAAGMLGNKSADCLNQAAFGVQTLINPEPNFYILGAKSYGRSSQFLYATGLAQIRDIFSLIGDRETLDLYASAHKLRAPR